MTTDTELAVPTLYEWAGGSEILKALMADFYERVKFDSLLEPVFDEMPADHPEHVAAFIGEVLGGPTTYSDFHGGHPEMVRHHLNRVLTEPQRKRWVELLIDAADAVHLPMDPEFRSAFLAYVEWGSRLAVINSQPGTKVSEEAPMPAWGWGIPGGPFSPK